ncbi:CDP-diacylglycerol--glycerol-3-phosphate 3-phosphatidyltransferase, mitochondrial isoform X2 [Aethina tumida]|uniref:CDP-diacylglycerol--glycerol-3-phosphate 3-phosphatidyltransferase, mitochondrial isoform X2 n=1 Tax=Aethina tumida TaxID=116153 RepID=UPI0021475362|nr:CDP-diacylglycerol--glycerol-3-phosphate 3-phosphatidyltransferase, mitochondrial isoform X2 [Aethina tumida]
MFRKIISNVIESTHPIETVYPCPFTLKDTSSFSWLMNYAPCFPINAANIKILTSPKEFYQAVVSHCESATQRVTMASLYVGNGELEKRIVTALRNNKSFKENKLKVNFLLDYNRGSRYKNNSRRMLLPLVQDNNKTCMVSLYHTPLLRANIRRLMPARWNELCGLQHMKLYIFDDTLIISGANLSHDYFTNRQDRYFMIKDKRLCDFYNTLVGKVQTFSFTLSKKDVPYVHDDWEYSPAFEGDKQEFIEKTGDMIEEYIYDTRMEQNVHKYEGYDTWIFPLIQMGQLGIDQDSVVTEKIFGEAPSGSQLRIASGYFNFTSKYMSTLIHRSQGQCSILMAHPEVWQMDFWELMGQLEVFLMPTHLSHTSLNNSFRKVDSLKDLLCWNT